MTDRELQEAAAKAAGIRVKWEPVHGCFWIEPGQGLQIDPWTPLTNDAQALRLAVKLKLWLRYRDDASVNVCWFYKDDIFAGNVTEEWGSLRNGEEPNAHVRRAIVRAAAEISREQGEGGR